MHSVLINKPWIWDSNEVQKSLTLTIKKYSSVQNRYKSKEYLKFIKLYLKSQNVQHNTNFALLHIYCFVLKGKHRVNETKYHKKQQYNFSEADTGIQELKIHHVALF